MARASQQALFPDNAYSVDSGGDPAAIPQLGFDQFQQFHGEFYHPGNARVYFMGMTIPRLAWICWRSTLGEFSERDIYADQNAEIDHQGTETCETRLPRVLQ